MDPVSNVDRLVLVLRERLLERSRTSGAARPSRGGADPARTGALGRLQALEGLDGLGDRELGRALIQNLLADQFGAEVVNSARFQQVVDRVTETLEQDPAGARLLGRVVKDLRNAAS